MSFNKKDYSYSFENNSLLDGLLMKSIVPVVLNKLPMTLAPNNITIFSGICAFSAFAITLQAAHGTYHLWALIPILYFIYLVSDCLDGAQARRTKMFSPAGEFLDHFFDSAVTGYLSGGILITYREMSPLYFVILLVLSYITQAAAFWERYRTGKMHFGRFSSTETVFALTAIIFAGSFEPVRNWVMKPLLWNLTPLNLFIIISGFFAFLNIVFMLIRAKGVNWNFILAIIFIAVTNILLCMTDFSLEKKVVYASLYSMIYLGRLLVAITMKKSDKIPDIIFPVILVCIIFIPGSKYLEAIFCFIYLFFSLMFLVINQMFEFINIEWSSKMKEKFARLRNSDQVETDSSEFELD